MRTFLGLFVLLLLFASAAAWQGRLTQDLRRRQGHQRGTPVPGESRAASTGETLSAGWNTLIVGRPSGAEPFFERRRREAQPTPSVAASEARGAQRAPSAAPSDTARDPLPPPLPRYEPDFQITVRSGDVLSKVCQGHYRTRPEGLSLNDIVGAVARYNGLPSPDAIKVGDEIRLPDVDRFVESD